MSSIYKYLANNRNYQSLKKTKDKHTEAHFKEVSRKPQIQFTSTLDQLTMQTAWRKFHIFNYFYEHLITKRPSHFTKLLVSYFYTGCFEYLDILQNY